MNQAPGSASMYCCFCVGETNNFHREQAVFVWFLGSEEQTYSWDVAVAYHRRNKEALNLLELLSID